MSFRCSLSTNIFVVLLISITCVNTKEIDSSVLEQSFHTDENTSTKNQRFDEQSSSLDGTFNEFSTNESQFFNINNNKKSNGNISNSYIYRISILNPNFHKKNHDHINHRAAATSAIADSLNINYNNDHIFKLDPLSRRDNFNVSSSNNTSYSSYVSPSPSPSPAPAPAPSPSPQTPTKSNAYKTSDHDFQTIQLGISGDRNGKDSNFRSALRVAARQGLEAMIELYDKKEPSLRNKGQFYFVFRISYFVYCS